jgi:hypothetical protein
MNANALTLGFIGEDCQIRWVRREGNKAVDGSLPDLREIRFETFLCLLLFI